jgi:hypothetical protein
MKKILFSVFLFSFIITTSNSQDPVTAPQDTTQVEQQFESTPPPVQKQAKKKKFNEGKRLYFGGNMTFNFGSYTRIGVYPMVGFKILPKLSVGAKIGYEYIKDKRWAEDYETSNYGWSLFSRWRIFRSLYLHAEYQSTNYDLYDSSGNSNREWVNFLLIGGGYSQPLGGNVRLNAQVLFDVLHADNSPYNAWEPVFSVGITAGF